MLFSPFYRGGTEQLSSLPQGQAASKWRVQVLWFQSPTLNQCAILPNDAKIFKVGTTGQHCVRGVKRGEIRGK